MLQCINLSLSNRCNANCIWCPKSRGTKHNYDMSFDIIKKIIDEISDSTFPHKIEMIHVSENGEALYNADFLNIVRYIKNKLPNVAINFLSNFGLMTNEISESLLKEKLLTSIQVNIDGHDKDSYFSVKGISFSSVIKNLKFFLEMREKYDPEFDFCINVMPAFEYAATVKSFLGVIPDRLSDNNIITVSTFEETEKFLRTFVPDNVRIRHSKAGLWAERNKIKNLIKPVTNKELECPLFSRVKQEAFIAPNGDWYACCLDDNNDLVLGNVMKQSIEEIYNSQTRLLLLQNLENKEFDKIGYPCSNVLACQTVTIKSDLFEELSKNFTANSKIKFKD